MAIALAGLGGAVGAAVIDARPVGLTDPDVVIDFGRGLFPEDTEITDQYEDDGVLFESGFFYITRSSNDPLFDGSFLVPRPQPTATQPGAISFNEPVSEVAFNWLTFPGTTSFTALLNDKAVESATLFTTGSPYNGLFFGFEGIVFDELRLSISAEDKSFRFDNLQFTKAAPPPGCIPSNYTPPKCEPWRPSEPSAVPLPAGLPLLLAGIGGLGLIARRKRKAT